MSVLDDWKNYDPKTGVGDPSTPLSAARMIALGAAIKAEVAQAETFKNQAEAAAEQAQAPTDAGMAAALDDAESQVRAALARVSGMQLSVRSKGALGDGTTDDGDAIQAAIDTLEMLGGGVVLLDGAGHFVTKRTLDLKSNVILRGDRASTLDYSQVPKAGSARIGIRARGTVGTPVPVTTAVNRGGLTVQVTSSDTAPPGTWVVLGTSGSNHYPYGGSTLVDRGEIKQVRSAGPTSLGFEQALYDRYDPAHGAFIAPVDMIENVAVENLRIVGTGLPGEGDRAIQLEYVNGFRVTGCDIERTDVYCVQLSCAIRGSVIDNTMRGVHYDGVTGSVFYAVSIMNACQWLRVVANHAEQVRHHTTVSANSQGQGYWGMPRFVEVIANTAQNMMVAGGGRSWAYEHHGFGDGIVFAYNIADGCYGGFVTRGPGVTFEGNIVRNWWQHAIEVHAQTVDARNIIIRANQVSDRIIAGGGATNPAAIRIQLDNAATVRNVVVEHNVLEVDATAFDGHGGIYATGTIDADLTIEANKLAWVGSGTAPSWLIRSTLPGTAVNRNRIRGDVRYGIRLDGAESEACDNTLVRPTQDAANGDLVYVNAPGCIVQGNRSRRTRYAVRSSALATGLALHSNIGQSNVDPFSLGTTTGLNAKANVWMGGTTAVNN